MNLEKYVPPEELNWALLAAVGAEQEGMLLCWETGSCARLEEWNQHFFFLLQERNLDARKQNCLLFRPLYIPASVGLH